VLLERRGLREITRQTTVPENHVSDNDNAYATLDCFIFMDSFGAQNLATKGTHIPYCNAMQDDDWIYNQLVDGDEKVFMCLVDYDLADGQLAHAAGRTPSKPHEWMVSNSLYPLLNHSRYARAE
jgi:hypothetical protein